MLDSLWGRLLDAVANKLPPTMVDQWVRPCRLLAVEGDHLKIGAPNTFSRDWLIQHHLQTLHQAAQTVIGGHPRLTIIVHEAVAEPTPADAPPPPAAARGGGGSTEGLNPRYTFDTFVVGSSNQFAQAACVIVKHANPCGVAVAATPLDAYEGAYRTDPTSAYGGVIAFNRELDAATATAVLERQFVEVLAAPAVHAAAARVLAGKPDVRVLLLAQRPRVAGAEVELRSVSGGLLAQSRDLAGLPAGELTVPTRRKPTSAEFADLRFAWAVCKFVKSNAIVFARAGATIGVGAGQMSRVYSTRLAAMKATDEELAVAGSVMASDAFLPFRDNLDVAAGYGIRAVIQPGGSKRDAEVIAAADQHDMAMVFTGIRHFRH